MRDNGDLRVLVADDHAIVRIGLRELFESAPGLQVVAEAGSGEEACALLEHVQVDLAIVDVHLPGMSGVDVCRAVKRSAPHVAVLMLTSFEDEQAVIAAVMAGASGFGLKELDPDHLIEGVKALAAGGAFFDEAATGVMADWIRRHADLGPNEAPSGLTEREREILALVGTGRTNRQIAATVCLSEHTIKTYVSRLLRKLGLSRRAELSAYLAGLGSASRPGVQPRRGNASIAHMGD
jgi:DNA-binding NarL/FixJ family response regulator